MFPKRYLGNKPAKRTERVARSQRRKSALYASVCFAFAGVIASPALAQVVKSASIENEYSYVVGGEAGSGSDNGGETDIFRSVTTGTGTSELGLSLTGTLADGSFFFLHDGHCVGDCTVTMTTNVTFTLQNLGSDPVDLRFDSQITPGHLANSFLETANNSTEASTLPYPNPALGCSSF